MIKNNKNENVIGTEPLDPQDFEYSTTSRTVRIKGGSTDLSEYIKEADADTKYLAKTDATSDYLTKAAATTSYLTKADATTTYQTKLTAGTDYYTATYADRYFVRKPYTEQYNVDVSCVVGQPSATASVNKSGSSMQNIYSINFLVHGSTTVAGTTFREHYEEECKDLAVQNFTASPLEVKTINATGTTAGNVIVKIATTNHERGQSSAYSLRVFVYPAGGGNFASNATLRVQVKMKN